MSNSNIQKDSLLRVVYHAGVQTWFMDFAPVNALSPGLLAELRAALQAAQEDAAVGAIVLTSDLKVFSGGGDASWMRAVMEARGPDALVDEFNQSMDEFRALCVEIRSSPLLIVAALNGHTLAGGLELAAACDLRFVVNEDRLRIGVPEMELFGVMPSGGGGAQFIARLMGPTRALQFILRARPLSPKQAYEAGLVDQLCEPGQLLAQAQEFASTAVAQANRIGLSAAKRAIFGGSELPFASAMTLDQSIHWDSMRRGNFRSGAAEFVKKFG